MYATDVVHLVAALAIGFTAVRGLQAIAEHFFPDSEAVVASRFIFGGPG